MGSVNRTCEVDTVKQKLLDRQCHDTTPPADKMPSRTAEKEVIEPKSDELIFFSILKEQAVENYNQTLSIGRAAHV